MPASFKSMKLNFNYDAVAGAAVACTQTFTEEKQSNHISFVHLEIESISSKRTS